jgi:hypothetical protein
MLAAVTVDEDNAILPSGCRQQTCIPRGEGHFHRGCKVGALRIHRVT